MQKQILVVDDAVDMQRLIKTILSEQSVDVHSATDPKYGLTLAASLKPDLILLDVDMPGMDGYEFCRQLKADSTLWAVPVLFLTAQGNTDQKVRGLELGAIDYITKPFNPAELLARVRAALRTQTVIQGLEDRALIDSLTGLGNQKMFLNRLRAEVSEGARSPRPMACTYIDLDGFQSINRHYGQPFGDAVLKKVAETLRGTYRPEDVSCRLTGDDFAVLLPATDHDEAVKLARTFKKKLASANFEYRGSNIPITCGLAITFARGLYDHSVLERAIAGVEKVPDRKSDGFWVQRDRKQAEAPVLA